MIDMNNTLTDSIKRCLYCSTTLKTSREYTNYCSERCLDQYLYELSFEYMNDEESAELEIMNP